MVPFSPDPSRVFNLLSHCPLHISTPLVEREGVLIKDESQRMGLGAFKALGGVYAVARIIEERWREATGVGLTPSDFEREDVRRFASSLTFVCASAGNHGMAVASGARLFGARARIFLADTVPDAFAARLEAKDAVVVRAGADYEASVDAAISDAAENDFIHLADGSWEGYRHAPTLVMEGYTVMAEELRNKFEADGRWPTHVYLQAGVGGFAGAIAHMIRQNWAVQPDIIIVEPEAAPCLKGSAAEGAVTTVAGPVSDMGRLDCKTPSLIAFEVFQDASVRYLTVSEHDARNAVAALSKLGIETTPSGAAGFAGLSLDRHTPDPADGVQSLVFVTEGAVSA
ncbi:MAG: pyridoxal-phosphate dependent enzyme [Pseudomonadota bacterium]